MDSTVCISIIIGDPFVSEDVAGIFAYGYPGSVSRIFDTVEDARSVPADEFDPTLVFVAARDGRLLLKGADFEWLDQRWVMTLDLRDRDRFPDWQHLARPFTQEQVINGAHRLFAGGQRERVEAE